MQVYPRCLAYFTGEESETSESAFSSVQNPNKGKTSERNQREWAESCSQDQSRWYEEKKWPIHVAKAEPIIETEMRLKISADYLFGKIYSVFPCRSRSGMAKTSKIKWAKTWRIYPLSVGSTVWQFPSLRVAVPFRPRGKTGGRERSLPFFLGGRVRGYT